MNSTSLGGLVGAHTKCGSKTGKNCCCSRVPAPKAARNVLELIRHSPFSLRGEEERVKSRGPKKSVGIRPNISTYSFCYSNHDLALG